MFGREGKLINVALFFLASNVRDAKLGKGGLSSISMAFPIVSFANFW